MELNERRVQVFDDGRMVTETRRIFVIEGESDIERFKVERFRIDAARESISLKEAKCYRRGKSGEWIEVGGVSVFKAVSRKESGIAEHQIEFPALVAPARIEYVVEVIRDKPLFGDYFWNMHVMSADMQVEKAIYRIEFPAGRDILYSTSGAMNAPVIEEVDEQKVYTWKKENVSAAAAGTTGVGAAAYVSSTPSWQPIATFFSKEYDAQTEHFKDIEDVVEGILNENIVDLNGAGVEANIATTRRVLGKFRTGASGDALIPRAAMETLKRRRGDCKDLAVLLVSLLRSMNIDAYPILTVHDAEFDLETIVPNPYIFNHVIVHIPRQGEMKVEMTIDPTTPDKPISRPPTGLALTTETFFKDQ